MSTTTQCPHCGTRFKANQAQLEAYHGMVRCGSCQTPFDAIENRIEDDRDLQMALPIAHDATGRMRQTNIGDEDVIRESDSEEWDGDTENYPELDVRETKWTWYAWTVILAMVLAIQSVYIFRVEIAARIPGLKPSLIKACRTLRCEIPLPKDANLIDIESSEMEADPAQAGIITLNITMRNRASYAQAYPNLELTLNDLNDQPVVRRTFDPAEYLKDPNDQPSGIAARRESTIRLTLETNGLQAFGYRVFLHY